MATYPGGVFAPASKSAGQTVQASFFNDPDAEITAVENALKNGIAHAVTISTGGLTVSTGGLRVGGPSTLAEVTAGASTLASLSVSGGSTLAGLSVAGLTVTSTASFASSVTVSGSMTVAGSLSVGSVFDAARPSVRLTIASDAQFTMASEFSPNWTVQDWSVGGLHSTTTNSSRITFAHSTGLYAIGASVRVANGPGTITFGQLRLRYNDTSAMAAASVGGVGGAVLLSVTDTVRATSTTDYVTTRLLVTDSVESTSRLQAASTQAGQTFWAYKVSN